MRKKIVIFESGGGKETIFLASVVELETGSFVATSGYDCFAPFLQPIYFLWKHACQMELHEGFRG
jgi:hypothetical protein